MADDLSREVEDRNISEDYKIWKKNAPLLYDVLLTQALDWPSLSVQWLPGTSTAADGQSAEHKLILGTHTSGDEQNYLMMATVRLPTESADIDARAYNEDTGELGGFNGSVSKIDISVRMNHEGEVNRARYCPKYENWIATKTPGADVLVFDYHKHHSRPKDNTVTPQMRLKGHTQEGYGLAWCPVEPARLLSASDDKSVCMWDLNASIGPGGSSKSSGGGCTVLNATHTIKGHTEVVEDVAWHAANANIFGSVGDDRKLLLWDLRDLSKPKLSIDAHKGHAMSLSFNPFNEFLLVTGGTDKLVNLWDSRKPKQALHVFDGHTDDVLAVSWAPFSETVLASSGADRRLCVWDCSLIGQEQSAEDAADGPPELKFVHGGHTARISDFSWNLTEDWVIASSAEDNILQVWLPADHILYGEEEEEEEEEEGAGAGGAGAGGAGRKRKVDDADLE